MVRPARLERATFWFVATNKRIIYNLAVGTVVVQGCAMLPVIKDFELARDRTRAIASNNYMRGVGTKMGTVDCGRATI